MEISTGQSVDLAKCGVESGPKYTHNWMSLIADRIERDRSHPCVVIRGFQYNE